MFLCMCSILTHLQHMVVLLNVCWSHRPFYVYTWTKNWNWQLSSFGYFPGAHLPIPHSTGFLSRETYDILIFAVYCCKAKLTTSESGRKIVLPHQAILTWSSKLPCKRPWLRLKIPETNSFKNVVRALTETIWWFIAHYCKHWVLHATF